MDNPNLTDNLIFHLRPMIFGWRRGGLCAKCAVNAANWNFIHCEEAFDRILNGGYTANPNIEMSAINIALRDFNSKLTAFQQQYQNCL